MNRVAVVGAGLAGCEAAWAIANSGIKVTLYEQKPLKFSPAHVSEGFAELVCSNSLKARRVDSAAGLLKEEMRRLGSICVETAYKCAVPAGGALAVERGDFSAIITERICAHPNITVCREEIRSVPDGVCVVATGPLTDGELAEDIGRLCGERLSFFDAAAPIVTGDSIDMNSAFFASRYDRGGGDDYINCPMDRSEYEAFYGELTTAEQASLHGFDKPPTVYEGCMPVEIMARRGEDTLRFGPLKPVGLRDPRTGHRPWAVVQLRREDRDGRLYNMVGFQTNLKFGEQKRVFSMIPALKNAEFVRYGVMHRNTFINSPLLLNADYSVRERGELFFAGQMTGVEGYMESAASGMLAGINAARRVRGLPALILPRTTMMGALAGYVSEGGAGDFQPMGANFGILPPLDVPIKQKRERYAELSRRALRELSETCRHMDIELNETEEQTDENNS